MAVVPPTGFRFIKGNEIDFTSEFQKGQTIFVFEFWATWCPPCRNSIPHLTQLQKKYKDKGVVFIGITNESEETARTFVQQMGDKMDYTVVVSSQNTLMQQYGIQGIPHAFIIGKDSKIVWHGHPMEGAFETYLQSAINLPSKSTLDPNASREKLSEHSVKELKLYLQSRSIDHSTCVEKSELIDLIKSNI